VTAPAEGNFAFTKDTNSLWYYDGAAWVASGATGDIEGVTAGVGISGGGTSGTVTITNSMATAIDAKGDLIVGTGADTFSRLAVGTNGHTLVADSAEATGLKWAAPGGASALTKITSASFSAVTTLDIDSLFSATYKRYMVILSLQASSSSELNLRFRAGGTTKTTSDYYGSGWSIDRANATFNNGQAAASSKTISQDATGGNLIVMYFMRVGNTSEKPVFTGILNGGAGQRSGHFGGTYDVADTYTGINLFLSANNMTGDYQVYGLEN
jgi:hypothetical protein